MSINSEKNRIFLNFSNHPSDTWTEAQKEAARKYGEIRDLQFPEVSAADSEMDIENKANNIVEEIKARSPCAVMCQGEFTLAYAIITRLLKSDINVVAACSERITTESKDEKGTVIKVSKFVFEKFRSFRMPASL